MAGKRILRFTPHFLIGSVVIFNLQAAISFLANPELHAPGYELEGLAGQSVIKGFGVLFLMWNIPYLVAFVNPIKYKISLYESAAMQLIGLLGESIIFCQTPLEYQTLRNSILRFVIFDAYGLLALIGSVIIVNTIGNKKV